MSISLSQSSPSLSLNTSHLSLPAVRETLTTGEFEGLVTEVSSPLMGLALRFTRRRAEAEDLVQETLYRAYRSLPSFRKGSRFRAWLFRILHNVFINRARHESRAPKAVDPSTMTPAAPQSVAVELRDLAEIEQLADQHFDERVKAAMDALPVAFREPMLLFAVGEMSYQEIAKTLRIPIGTVMSRLHRARGRLRASLADYAHSHNLA